MAKSAYTNSKSRFRLSSLLLAMNMVLFIFVGRWSFDRLTSGRGVLSDMSDWLDLRYMLILSGIILLMFTRDKKPERMKFGDRWGKSAFYLMHLFFFYFILSSAWSPDPDLAFVKCVDVVCVLLMTVIVHLASKRKHREQIFRYFHICALAVASALGLVGIASFGASARLKVLGGGPNIFGRLMGVGGLCSFQLRKFWGIPGIIATVIFTALVMLSSSRGAIVSFVAAFSCLFLFGKTYSTVKKIVILIAITGLSYLVLFHTEIGNEAFERFRYRIIELTWEGGNYGHRDELFRHAVSVWERHPVLGTGINGWTALHYGNYPHNLFLEIGCEGGWIGFILLASSQVAAGVHFWLNRKRANILFICLWILYLLASQVSGDVFDARNVFIFMTIALYRQPLRKAAPPLSYPPADPRPHATAHVN